MSSLRIRKSTGPCLAMNRDCWRRGGQFLGLVSPGCLLNLLKDHAQERAFRVAFDGLRVAVGEDRFQPRCARSVFELTDRRGQLTARYGIRVLQSDFDDHDRVLSVSKRWPN
jgi:hypothetical protein